MLMQKKMFLWEFRDLLFGPYNSRPGVAADPGKIKAMVKWPIPRNVTELRGFLGLTGYYSKFVKNYGQIVRTLTEVLRKTGFAWSKSAGVAFQALRTAVTNLHVLILPDFDKEFTIETDAFGIGIGAVLSHGKQPVAI